MEKFSTSSQHKNGKNIQEIDIEKRENEEETTWDNKRQFLLTIIGYSVGIGNIWRFPYLCQKNGGGAFLIPFALMVIIQGAPLLLIELGIGQRLRAGSLKAWHTVHPFLGGIGIASTVIAFLVGLYYNVIIAWIIFYLINSLTISLPWSTCPNISISGSSLNGSIAVLQSIIIDPECSQSSETAYFWYRKALNISPGIDTLGGINWSMAGCLLVAWTLIYLIVMRGIKSSGKVVYFTALFPYLVLTIFCIRGLTLPGAAEGLLHLLKPNFKLLLSSSVWFDAATQVFFSFGIAFGTLTAFGSYNQPKNNCVKDVILIAGVNAFTAIYASVVIFSVLGFKAWNSYQRCLSYNKYEMALMYGDVFPNAAAITDEQVTNFLEKDFVPEPFKYCSLQSELNSAAAGTGLAFIVFTQAVVELPISTFWSVIFFLMLLALATGSQIGMLEAVVNTVFASSYYRKIHKEILTAGICGLALTIGLLFVTNAGEYWVSLFDNYASTIVLVVIALLETTGVMYIYGHERFSKDIEDMTGYYPGLYWQVCWRFLGPMILIILFVSSVWNTFTASSVYNAWNSETASLVTLEYPTWVMGIAYLLMLLGVLPLVIVFVRNCIKSFKQKS